MLTVEELREVFSYEQESGALYWKVDSGQRARAGMRANQIGRYRDFFEACCSRKSTEKTLGYHANHGRA